MKHICETMKDYVDSMNTSFRGDTIFCTEELWNQIMKLQPERSKREDPHLNLYDMINMLKEQMIERIKELEDTIIRQYIENSSCYVCNKCVGCGALNSMET